MKQAPKASGYLPTPTEASRDIAVITADTAKDRFSFGRPAVELEIPEERPAARHNRRGRWGSLVACGLLLLGLALLLIPTVYHAIGTTENMLSSEALREQLFAGLLSRGLPPVNEPILSSLRDTEESDTSPETDTRPSYVETVTEAPALPETAPVETSPDEPPEEPSVESDTDELPPAYTAPIVAVDMSESHKGAEHILFDPSCPIPPLPESLSFPPGSAVLIVHSHPYETYGDGGDVAWHNGEGWAVEVPEDGAYSSTGVVALGEQLTLLLRLRGVEVIHAVLPMDDLPSHMNTYERTQALVEDLLTRYPQIAFVLDLRRGAEQLPDGSLLRTQGRYQGEPTAQLNLVVNLLRSAPSQSQDMATALRLRRWMYGVEPSMSRPVCLRQGEGLSANGSAVMLTLELGTAGNTYEEASRLLRPLADAVADVLSAHEPA